MAIPVSVTIAAGDVLTFDCDVLALKYAQRLYGVDKAIVTLLLPPDPSALTRLPKEKAHLFISSSGKLKADKVLMVGVVPLYQFRYQEIREFARSSLAILGREMPETKHLALTLHGVGYGLDEKESFESEIAGLVDAVASGMFPRALERITVVDIANERVNRLRQVLNSLLPSATIGKEKDSPPAETNERASATLRSAGYGAASKPSVFVAMPFSEDMDDVFHYGIQGAVNAAGALCERADLTPFTGDIMDWVKDRIGTASMIIADLTGANPNVYLEVGYAWGRGKPTILLVQDPADLRFDLKGHRVLVYRKIQDLEKALSAELEALSGHLGPR